MPRLLSFPPIADARARVLVLGSMPGAASLRAGQYYAHPQNGFWTILGDLLGEPLAELRYEQRAVVLRHHRIALWDVLHSCERRGSLDADIEDDTIVPNDFAGFFARHRGIRMVFCNGQKAAACYRKCVLPTLSPEAAAMPLQVLPSTSPAHASLRLVEKRRRWRAILVAIAATGPKHQVNLRSRRGS